MRAAALTPARRRALAAAMERILPSGGDGSPGAAEAHAVGFADFIVGRAPFAPAAPALETGLALLDTLARATAGADFADCGPGERDAVLLRVRETPHPTVQRFFTVLVRLSVTGFLCHPAYGGNRGGAGWAFIGFAPHPHTAAGVAPEEDPCATW